MKIDMKIDMNIKRLQWLPTLIASTMLFAGIAAASAPSVTQSIEPATIELGRAAELTISASGTDTPQITPPMVAGLEFVAVAQAQRVESINGVTASTTSVTYQVIPQEAGVYTIPGAVAGSPPVVLTVNPAGGGSPARGGTAAAPPAAGMLPAGRTGVKADGTAFVRLLMPKHELYVGETVPVDIEVGMRDGFVASLNGLPTLNGDEFTLNKLSSEPQRTEETINGQPFTVLTWHSALAAVKPGKFSLTVETPLTVRMRTRSRAAGGLFGGAGMDDFFNDPMFQNFFGTSTEREIAVSSNPAEFSVLALPTQDRPGNFTGAVGQFTVSSDLSEDKATAGDPVTLRMRVSGTGNFDRVNSPMLQNVPDWKTYAPTAKFQPSDSIGFRGVKTFEQPVIAMRPGAQSLPPLTFSWFDPDTRQYAQARTSPLTVDMAAPTKDGSVAQSMPPASRSAPAAKDTAGDGLRADHLVTGRSTASLTPHYYQPAYLGVPSALILAFSGAFLWIRRRDHAAADALADGARSLDTEPLLRIMDDAMAAGNPEVFFKTARTALQRDLAAKWLLTPDSITPELVAARLGEDSGVVSVFKVADETAYAGAELTALELRRWKQLVIDLITHEATS
jgi:hypothetical protein